MFEEILIRKIEVGIRLRQDLGDIKELAQSIDQIGLLNPITVRKENSKYYLLAGERRLKAIQYLKKKTIQARIIKNEIKIGDYFIMDNKLNDEDFENSCEICDYPITEEHHIWPKWFGGPDDEKNKINLCPNHHYFIDLLTRIAIHDHYPGDKELRTKQTIKKYEKIQSLMLNYEISPFHYFEEYIKPAIPLIVKKTNDLVKEMTKNAKNS